MRNTCVQGSVGFESEADEQRFVTLGLGGAGPLLIVVYTWRGENIRIIFARPPKAAKARSTRQNTDTNSVRAESSAAEWGV